MAIVIQTKVMKEEYFIDLCILLAACSISIIKLVMSSKTFSR